MNNANAANWVRGTMATDNVLIVSKYRVMAEGLVGQQRLGRMIFWHVRGEMGVPGEDIDDARIMNFCNQFGLTMAHWNELETQWLAGVGRYNPDNVAYNPAGGVTRLAAATANLEGLESATVAVPPHVAGQVDAFISHARDATFAAITAHNSTVHHWRMRPSQEDKDSYVLGANLKQKAGRTRRNFNGKRQRR